MRRGQRAEETTAPPIRLYESGQYEAAAAQVRGRLEAGEASPEEIYWAGQSLLRLNRDGEAAEMFARLGGEDDNDPWRAVGRSASLLAQGQQQPALQQAVRATELAGDLFYAHYQHALVRMDGAAVAAGRRRVRPRGRRSTMASPTPTTTPAWPTTG